MDYLLKNKLIKFYGETALSRNGAVASLNALQLTPASYFSLLLLYRYYDKRYQAFFGNAFSQNSAVRNEQGMYIGMQWTPFARWKLSAYGGCIPVSLAEIWSGCAVDGKGIYAST